MIDSVTSDKRSEILQALNTLPVGSPEWSEKVKELAALHAVEPAQALPETIADATREDCPNCFTNNWKPDTVSNISRLVCGNCGYVDSDTEEKTA